MYESYFQLRERPFALSPDPDYLYPSRVHREALAYLRYGIESQAGFVVITGEIGSGKTTLLQALLRGLDAQTTVVRLMNTLLEPRELLEAIAIDLGIVPSGTSKPALLRDLSFRLVEERAAGRIVLLVIDEAQNLGLPALEEIRMLSNLETEKSKLIQTILVGQPDLRQQLDLPRLEQLRQRITVSYHLDALDQDETEAYINHRLRRAALGTPMQLGRDVTDRVHERAKGVPRIINVICDAALVYAYAEDRRSVDAAMLTDVFQELEATGVLKPLSALQAVTSAYVAQGANGNHVEPVRQPVTAESSISPAAEVSIEHGAALDRSREIAEQQSMLRLREDQIARRERQLGEQQRVLAEEYRLFRSRQSRELARGAAEQARQRPFHATTWPPAPVAVSDSWEESERRTFWDRVKQAITGVRS